MTSSFSIFGPVVTTHTVEKAIMTMAQEWLPVYISAVAVSQGLAPGSVAYPLAYQDSYDFDNYQAGNTPVFIVVVEGTTKEIERNEDGEVGAWFLIEAAVLEIGRAHV